MQTLVPLYPYHNINTLLFYEKTFSKGDGSLGWDWGKPLPTICQYLSKRFLNISSEVTLTAIAKKFAITYKYNMNTEHQNTSNMSAESLP